MRTQCTMPRRYTPIPDTLSGNFSSELTTVWNNVIPNSRFLREDCSAAALLVHAASPLPADSGHCVREFLVGTHDGLE